jgi:hypothetical protein
MIKEEHRPSGSGGIYTIVAGTENEALEYANAKKNSIDYYRSPSILSKRVLPSGEYEVQIKYYGLD